MEKTILFIATLDTKNVESEYLKEAIYKIPGCRVLVMDISMAAHAVGNADISAAEVARSGGSTIEEINQSRERAKITAIMIKGAVAIAKELLEDKKIDGVIGLGGSTGSLMATDVMRALPFGVPKVMVSATAALPGLATRYIGTGDIMLFHSVIEIAGLSPLLKNVLERAAAAIAGMVQVDTPAKGTLQSTGKKAIAMSQFGICEGCASAVRIRLEAKNYDVISFSAAGVCDRAMEEMIAKGLFDAVIDLAPGGVGEYLMEGMRSAGPHRLEAAGKLGIPQIIAPSGVNLMSPRKSRYKPDYHKRKKFDLDKLRTFLRLNEEEIIQVAVEFARKLNQATGSVRVLLPLRGWSSIDGSESQIYEPETDYLFIENLKKNINNNLVVIKTFDLNLEDEAFATHVVENLLDVLPQ
ncbi:MAG: Tm-1-like ATP-binding domain-containing protein [Pseudomonadota bacterium]|nr:Tm-1-like ATP-binding domain-containing protein [Pseudomonadota bacterium]